MMIPSSCPLFKVLPSHGRNSRRRWLSAAFGHVEIRTQTRGEPMLSGFRLRLRSIECMVRSKLLVIDGFDFKEFHPEGVAPVNDTKLYSLTFPTAEGNLAMRQTALDEWSVKFARLKKDYDETVEKHNKEFNPSGFPYKADGQKRQAPSTEGEEAEGAPFPEDCMVESLEALKKAEGSLSTVRSLLSTVHLVFTSKGAMYLHAQETGVVSAKRPLCQVFGEYHSGPFLPTPRHGTLPSSRVWRASRVCGILG